MYIMKRKGIEAVRRWIRGCGAWTRFSGVSACIVYVLLWRVLLRAITGHVEDQA